MASCSPTHSTFIRDRTGFPRDWLPDNSERVERQQNTPIQVIVGNPPWSAGQRSSADDNPNVEYPELEKRVADTYAARSTATLKNSLYDTYKMAIRWASDRIGDRGVVALVTNGSWIDGNVDSGVRACLAEEFTTIYVMNLRGNQRTQGERSRQEGGKVFGQGSRAPVAITILIRNPDAEHDGCRILYHDIGDYGRAPKAVVPVLEGGPMGLMGPMGPIGSNRVQLESGSRVHAVGHAPPRYTAGRKPARNRYNKLTSLSLSIRSATRCAGSRNCSTVQSAA